ncbi:MAG TPA: VOC family protein [Dehalococcoidia bacterium]|jgi:catechol 2,3-dioxygenase-like lactoylglutathione lyase family enzyme|nr:VOC family protein [Dehalococcoidia bacterium]
MQIVDSYPVVVTSRLEECRDFYRLWLDFEVVFEATWFVLLNSGGTSIAFMHPEHPSSPPDPDAYTGEGMFLTLQVEDAGAEYERLVGNGLQVALPLTDEPWGQRRFALVDPAGMWVDIVEQIEPQAVWWDEYVT